MQDRYGVQLMGVGRNRERITKRLRDVRIRAGDMLILRAGEAALPNMMEDLGLLPLAERSVKIGDQRGRWLPLIILAVAMILLALGGAGGDSVLRRSGADDPGRRALCTRGL